MLKNKTAIQPPLMVLVGVWAFLNFRVLFEGHNFVYMDAANFFYPLWKWGGEALKGGHIPLWDPDLAFGFPYLADPETLCWYPPRILLYSFFQAGTAFKLLDLFHYLWMLVGFFLFAREKGFSGWALLAGGLAFGFSFEVAALSFWAQSMFITATWIPWVFWAAYRVYKGKKGGLLVFSFFFAMQLASGYPIYAYLTLFAVLVEKSVDAAMNFKDQKKGLVHQVLLLAAGTGVAVLYNLAWVLPFLEFVPLSNIGRRLDLSSSLGFSNLVTWINPFFCGHPLFDHQSTPFSVSIYFMGLPAAVLITWGLFNRKVGRGSAVKFVFFLFLSLGATVGVGEWLKSFVPGYRWIARSGYWLPLVCFFGALIVMEAARNLIQDKGNKINLLWCFMTVLAIFLSLMSGVPPDLFSFWAGGLLLALPGLRFFNPFLRGLFLAFAFGCSIVPVLQGIRFTLPQTFYDTKPPACEVVTHSDRIFHMPDFIDEYRMVSGANVGDIYGKFKNVLLPNWPMAYGYEETGINNTMFLMEFLRWYYTPLEAPLPSRGKFLDYLNTGYVFGLGGFPGDVPEDVGGGVSLWVNPRPLPKWFSVTSALPETSWAEGFQAMCRPGFDFSKVCFLKSIDSPHRYQKREIRAMERSNNHLAMDLGPGKDALLVSSELAYPGWKASVEGEGRPLQTVNYSFRGVALNPGEGRVALDYQPDSFRLGMFLSFLAMAIWSTLLMFSLQSHAKFQNA